VYINVGRRTTAPSTSKTYWHDLSKTTGSNPVVASTATVVHSSNSRSTPELDSYLSRRRNTTGSIHFTKAVDLNKTQNKVIAGTDRHQSLNKLDNLFQAVEDSDLITTKCLITTHKSLINR
ncbi:unnamed protein product, partial [Didymodactylos carnosus]